MRQKDQYNTVNYVITDNMCCCESVSMKKNTVCFRVYYIT